MSLTAGASTVETSTDDKQVEARHLIADRARLVLLSFLTGRKHLTGVRSPVPAGD